LEQRTISRANNEKKTPDGAHRQIGEGKKLPERKNHHNPYGTQVRFTGVN